MTDGTGPPDARCVCLVRLALLKADIHIVALHNHMIGEQPAFYFTHFWGKGPAKDWLLIKKRDEDARDDWQVELVLTEEKRRSLEERVPPCDTS